MKTIKQITKVLSNHLNAAIRRKQNLISLIDNGDLNRLLPKLCNKNQQIRQALEEYNPSKHKVTKRPNKPQKDKPDIETAKIPIPYQKVINMQATAFLFWVPGAVLGQF